MFLLGGAMSNHPFVREQKLNQTKAEIKFKRIILQVLRTNFPVYRHSLNTQVRFNHPRGFYIVDFYIGQLKVAFEIDGGYHWNSNQIDRDLKRDHFLNTQHRIVIKHIPNNDILKGGRRKKKMIQDVIQLIGRRISTRMGLLQPRAVNHE